MTRARHAHDDIEAVPACHEADGDLMLGGGERHYEVFLEPKNVCVSLGTHHIPHWGA